MPPQHCRLCGTTKDVTRHHLIPQGLSVKRTLTLAPERLELTARFVGYPTSEIRHHSNIVPLCRLHHDLVERRVLVSTLRLALRESEVLHVQRVAGPGWLDAHYPEPQIGTSV